MTLDSRPGDATDQFGDIELYTPRTGKSVTVYRDWETGAIVGQPELIRDKKTGLVRHVAAPPPLTEAQHKQAAAQVQALFSQIELNPRLKTALLENPQALWLLPEEILTLSPSAAPAQAVYDSVEDITEAILTSPASTSLMKNYAELQKESETQQVFWSELGDPMGTEAKLGLTTLFANLEPQGAENIASLALAWSEGKDMTLEENQRALYLNMWGWGYARDQYELGEQGAWGRLDAPQEFVEQNLITPAINWAVKTFGSADSAVRRAGLTPGQQAAYQVGARPPENAGEMGVWNTVSGILDAQVEIGADPLNLLGALGASSKAIKTIPLSAKAIRAGRTARVLQSALAPKILSGAASRVSGGRTARIIYSFGAKGWDEVVGGLAKTQTRKGISIAEDIARVLREDGDIRFDKKYKSFRNMNQAMRDAIRLAKNGDEVVEVMKFGALNDQLLDPKSVNKAKDAARSAWQTFVANEGGIDPGVRMNPEKAKTLPWLEGTAEGAFAGVDHAAVGMELLADAAASGRTLNNMDLALDALKKQGLADNLAKAGRDAFVIIDVPAKLPGASRLNPFAALRNSTSQGRMAVAGRRIYSRISQAVPSNIDIFSTKKSTQQIRQLMRHYGTDENTIDDLLEEYIRVDPGARQDFVMERVMEAIGTATGIAPLKYNLAELFKRRGLTQFNSGGLELGKYVDADGVPHNMPTLPEHMQNGIPIPVKEIDQIVRRYKDANGSISAIRKGISRISPSNTKRSELMRRFKNQIKRMNGGELPEELSALSPEDLDDALWKMAYSHVNLTDDAADGRGWMAGTLGPRAGNAYHKLHTAFTQSMLVARAGQWMWRVALLEEQLRGAIFNLPSMYRNPFAYALDLRNSDHIKNFQKWKTANLAVADTIYRNLTDGTETIADLAGRIGKDLLDEILGPDSTDNLYTAQRKVKRFIDAAVQDTNKLDKLKPVQKIGYRVKNRTHNIERGKKLLQERGLSTNFNLTEDAAGMNGKMLNVYFTEQIASGGTDIYRWSDNMGETAALAYGRAYGGRIVQLVESSYGNIGLRRLAARRAGVGMTGDISADAIIEHRHWKMMKPDLARRFAGQYETEQQLAELYMKEMVEREAEILLSPLLQGLSPEDQGKWLNTLANRRQLDIGDIGDEIVPINLSGGNVGKGVRDLANRISEMNHAGDARVFPEVSSGGIDPRWMAVSDKGFIRKAANQIMQTMGNDASMALNRRPAWLREYTRWNKIYLDMGVPEEIAIKMANDHAVEIVNHVYYNVEAAPALIAKLNGFIPFFAATYEVLGTWTYKMPAEVGGNWALGVGEFARKIDRLMDAFVNIGLVTRTEEGDGNVTHSLNLAATSEHPNELGEFLKGAAWNGVKGMEGIVGHLLGMGELQGLRDDGITLAVGNPLNPFDYGIMSFAQANIGMNPVPNMVIAKVAPLIFSAGDSERLTTQKGQTLLDVADLTDADFDDVIRLNREVFFTEVGVDEYNMLLAGTLDLEDVELPAGTQLILPDTDIWSTVLKDIISPFGEADNVMDLPINFLPGVVRYGLMGLGIMNTPTDEFWSGEGILGDDGILPAFIPDANASQMSAMASEAFMYVESHYLIDGKGPFQRVREKAEEVKRLKNAGDLEGADRLKAEVDIEEARLIELVKKTTAEALLLRSITGSFMPTSPGHLREQRHQINSFWDSREYADSLKAGKGVTQIKPFKSVEEIDSFFGLVASWMQDSTGDDAKGRFLTESPELLAYLTPKTYYGEVGIPPQINSFEDYQRQIESGERIVAPVYVTMARAQSSFIQADYYNKYIGMFGNDPLEAAANALNNREMFDELKDDKDIAYQALYLQDDLHGGLYDKWQKERYADDSWALEEQIDAEQEYRNSLSALLDLEESITAETGLDEIKNLRSVFKAAISKVSESLNTLYEIQEREPGLKNPYEQKINQWYEEVYTPYNEEISELYDELSDSADSEEVSFLYEKIKLVKNEWAGAIVFLDDNSTVPFPTPLDYQWSGRTPEERLTKAQQAMTRPLEWIDLDTALRVVEHMPEMESYLPTTIQEFDIYREWTLKKIEIDELYEVNAITTGERSEMQDQLEENVINHLLAEGRGREVQFMKASPIEKLEISGTLPAALGIYPDQVRFYKQELAAMDTTAGSIEGRNMLIPFYLEVEQAAYRDENLMTAIRTLGENLFDKSSIDNILPWLFFGSRQEQ